MDTAITLAVISAILAPIVMASLAGIRWVFSKMEARLQKEIDDLKVERKVLQGKVDQLIDEAIEEQKALIRAYQENAAANRQVSQVVADNNKVLEVNTKALEDRR